MVTEKKARNKNTRGWDEWAKEIDRLAEGSSSAEEILAQLEKGDFSSLDPAFLESDPKDLERYIRERNEKYGKNKNKKRKAPEKDPEVSL